MNQLEQKRASAHAALRYIETGSVLGMGTGSTVNALIEVMAEKKHLPRACVSSSNATTQKLQAIGVEVIELNHVSGLDVCIDGADECSPYFHLIKGGGGALTREKIIIEAAREFICLIDDSKLVDILGAFPLPIEIIPMARSLIARKMVALGGTPHWREVNGQAFVTDNGNWILDVRDLKIMQPFQFEQQLEVLPGVVTSGLFARRNADRVICSGRELAKQT